MLETLKTLCALDGVSSNEKPVRDYIVSRARAHADDVQIDPMGNVLIFKAGKRKPGKKVMVCAHMDEVGLVITYIHDNGQLSYGTAGGIDPRILPGKRVEVGDGHIPGVIGLKPPHLSDAAERSKVPRHNDLLIDIGAGSREKAEALVSPGDTVCFSGALHTLGGGLIGSKAIDDRVGCALLLKLLEDTLPVDCHFAFTVQEEVGCRGATVAAYRVEPDIALVVEGTTAADLPGIPTNRRICSPGKGPVIPFMDGGSVYDRELTVLLTLLAEEAGIPWQTKRRIAGGTDASVIQRSRGGVRVAAISAALRNIHTPCCVGSVQDMENMERLARLFLKRLGEIV